ncbi:hypothetical protein Tco_1375030 [Tanacetum coccineum]
MIANYKVCKISMDGGSSVDIIYEHWFNKLLEHVRRNLKPPAMPLIGFLGERYTLKGWDRLTTVLSVGIAHITAYNMIDTYKIWEILPGGFIAEKWDYRHYTGL